MRRTTVIATTRNLTPLQKALELCSKSYKEKPAETVTTLLVIVAGCTLAVMTFGAFLWNFSHIMQG